MSRKSVVVIIVIIVIILIAVSAWLVYKKYFKAPVAGDGGDQTPPPYDYTPPPSGGGYSSVSFPIKKGMSGQMVVDVQDSINKKCKSNLTADGKFGPLTQSALKSCYNATTVSQALYTQMKLDAVGSPSTNGFNAGDKVYLKSSIANIYNYPSFDSSYILGSMEKSSFLDKPIGYYVSPATSGFVKIKIFGYKPYGSSTYIVSTKEVYISINSIQKTPY